MATTDRYGRQNQTTAPPQSRAPGSSRPRSTAPEGSGKKPWLVAAATAAVLVLGVAAFYLWPKGPEAGCVIAIDAQGSTSPMTAAYREWLPAQAERCAGDQQGKLSIALISGETRTSSVTPVTTHLRELKLTGNAERDRTIIADEIDRVILETDKKILSAPEQQGGTDILGILCVAEDLLDGREPKTLIINSDGMNNRAPYVLTDIPLDEASITQHVEALRAEGQLCDLSGTRVEMYGIGIGWGTSEMPPEQLAGVQRFWTAVVTATGAELATYQRNP